MVGSCSNWSDEEQLSHSLPGFDVMADVGRCRSIAHFVGKNSQLVLYSLMNWQPVQLLEEWLGMRLSWRLKNSLSCSVLYALQLLNTACWGSMQHSIAVVQPRQYQAACQCNSKLSRQ